MVVLCLFLTVFLAFAQAVHFHSNPSDADHCVLCVVMHSAVPVSAIAAIVVFVQLGFSAPLLKARAMVRYWHPQLFTRPPPAGC